MSHWMGETIPLSDLTGAEQVDSERAGLLGKGRIPIGKRRIQFNAELSDGRRFLATGDTACWQRISAAAFQSGDGPTPSWDRYVALVLKGAILGLLALAGVLLVLGP